MTTMRFAKGHAAGDDFVIVSDPDGLLAFTPAHVRAICDRHEGVGANGVIRAVRSRAIAAGEESLIEEPEAEWFLDLWTSDGTPRAMGAGAIRVYAHYLVSEGLVAPAGNETLPIGTRDGVRDVLIGASGYTVDLGRWKLGEEVLVSAKGLDIARPAQGVWLGEQHVVAALANAAELGALELGVAPVTDPASVTNVEFVVPEDQMMKNGVGQIRLRAYDAINGETPSNGAGAAAAALVFRHWGGAGMPHHWSVETPGGRIAVRMFPTQEGEHVSLGGPVAIIARGEYTVPF